MATIGFIGLGNMGGPMAANLVRAGHTVRGFDLAAPALDALARIGGHPAGSAAEAASGADILITMLPAGPTCAPSCSRAASSVPWRPAPC